MPDRVRDEQYMRLALEQAREAERAGEIPVGAVVVLGGRVIGRGSNSPIGRNDPTAHAEILALRESALTVNNYRLEKATVFSTLEPCVMCAGALVAARVRRLVFAARDIRFGAVRSKFRLADSELLNHRVQVEEGPLAAECVDLLRAFLQRARERPPAGLDRNI
jgi:tRNA(adenine34) deaminase